LIFFILKQNTKKKNSLNCIKRKRNSSIKFYFFLRGGARQEEGRIKMAAITKVSLSFKETRQKTLAKLEGINRNRISADFYRKSAVAAGTERQP